MPEPEAYQVGIRSFLQWAEYLEDETHAMLSLLQYFEGRKIKSPELWQAQVFPELENFISRTVIAQPPAWCNPLDKKGGGV